MHSRKLYYYIDSPYIEVADIPNPLYAKKEAEAKATEAAKKKEKSSNKTSTVKTRHSTKQEKSTEEEEEYDKKEESDTLPSEDEDEKDMEEEEDEDEDEDNESLIKIKEKIKNNAIKLSGGEEITSLESQETSSHNENSPNKKHKIERQELTKPNKHQKMNQDVDADNQNHKLKEDQEVTKDNNHKIKEKVKKDGENETKINENQVNSENTKESEKKKQVKNDHEITIQKKEKEKEKENQEKDDKDEMALDSNPLYQSTKKDPDPPMISNYNNKPDELISQLSSDINDLVGVSLIASKPNDLEMDLISDYSSDFSVSTSHFMTTDQDSDGIDDIQDKDWDIPRPELMSMNELDSLFGDSDLDDLTPISEDSRSMDSFSTTGKKRSYDMISTESEPLTPGHEPKKLNSLLLNNPSNGSTIGFLKRNHVKKASGLSQEIVNHFSDEESPTSSEATMTSTVTDKKEISPNGTPLTSIVSPMTMTSEPMSITTKENESPETSVSVKNDITIKKEDTKEEKEDTLVQTTSLQNIKLEEKSTSTSTIPSTTTSTPSPTKVLTNTNTQILSPSKKDDSPKKYNPMKNKPAPTIAINMFYPSSKELIRIFTEAHTQIEYEHHSVNLRKIIHGKFNGDLVFIQKTYNCFVDILENNNQKMDIDVSKDDQNPSSVTIVEKDSNNNFMGVNYKLEKINTEISCSGFVDVSSLFSRKELTDRIIQQCQERMKTKPSEFTWWGQYVSNIIEWTEYIFNNLNSTNRIKELLQNTKVEVDDINTMKKSPVLVICLTKDKSDLYKAQDPESLQRFRSLNVFSNNHFSSHQKSSKERTIVVIQHSETWKGIW